MRSLIVEVASREVIRQVLNDRAYKDALDIITEALSLNGEETQAVINNTANYKGE